MEISICRSRLAAAGNKEVTLYFMSGVGLLGENMQLDSLFGVSQPGDCSFVAPYTDPNLVGLVEDQAAGTWTKSYATFPAAINFKLYADIWNSVITVNTNLPPGFESLRTGYTFLATDGFGSAQILYKIEVCTSIVDEWSSVIDRFVFAGSTMANSQDFVEIDFIYWFNQQNEQFLDRSGFNPNHLCLFTDPRAFELTPGSQVSDTYDASTDSYEVVYEVSSHTTVKNTISIDTLADSFIYVTDLIAPHAETFKIVMDDSVGQKLTIWVDLVFCTSNLVDATVEFWFQKSTNGTTEGTILLNEIYAAVGFEEGVTCPLASPSFEPLTYDSADVAGGSYFVDNGHLIFNN